jgi:hypothetical protein
MAVDKTKLHDAVEYAAEFLPEGWQITIEIERDSGCASLFDEWGDMHDYPTSHECLADTVRDAAEYAIEEDAKANGRD